MRRGVTLLEVLVAAFLLSVGLLAGLEAMATSAATARQADDHAHTMMAARTKLEDVLSSPSLETGEDRREWPEDNPQYDLITNIAAHDTIPNLVIINVSAVNKKTGTEVILSAMRRQDVSDSTDTGDGTTTDTGTDTGGTTGGGTM